MTTQRFWRWTLLKGLFRKRNKNWIHGIVDVVLEFLWAAGWVEFHIYVFLSTYSPWTCLFWRFNKEFIKSVCDRPLQMGCKNSTKLSDLLKTKARCFIYEMEVRNLNNINILMCLWNCRARVRAALAESGYPG